MKILVILCIGQRDIKKLLELAGSWLTDLYFLTNSYIWALNVALKESVHLDKKKKVNFGIF